MRKSFLASLEVFLLAVLGVSLILAISIDRTTFEERLRTSARGDLLYDLLATWQSDGRIYEIFSPLKTFYQTELAFVEKKTGTRLCLYLDNLPLYRQECVPVTCAHSVVAQGTLAGTVEFRKVEVCSSK